MSQLAEKIKTIHLALTEAQIPHAFGGALALAWCTQAARATIDIDVNLFVSIDAVDLVFHALPGPIEQTKKLQQQLVRDTQVRLWWGQTPVDIFLNSTPYHEEAATRVRWETFAGSQIPFLSCQDIAVFKAFFNRTQDWADLEAMHLAGTLDIRFVSGVMVEYLGVDDDRLTKLMAISANAHSRPT